MLKGSTTTMAALLLSALGVPGLRAAEAPAPVDPVPTPDRAWAFDAGAEYASRYLFRGVSLLGNQHVLSPHARFCLGHLAIYAYGYSGSIPDAAKDSYREVDLGADYTFWFGERVAMTLGAVTYQYNHAAEHALVFLDTYEVYGVVAIDTVLSPTISYYRDVHAVKGGFLTVAVSRGVDLGSRARLVFTGSAGFDFGYNDAAGGNGTWNDVLLGVDLPIRISDAFSVHAGVQRSIAERALDRGVARDPSLAAFYGNQTVATVGLAYSF